MNTCANAMCKQLFTPKVHNQRFCSYRCRRVIKEIKRKARQLGKPTAAAEPS